MRDPLWVISLADRDSLLAAAETIGRACRLCEDAIPAAASFDAGQIARVTEVVAALPQN